MDVPIFDDSKLCDTHFFSTVLKIVTENHLKARWSGGKPGEYFRCGFCGHKFVLNDKFRCLYTNDMPGASGNPLVCEACTTKWGTSEDLREEWAYKWSVYKKATENDFWWFGKNN